MGRRVGVIAATVVAGAAFGAPGASADTNGPTTRDCSLLVPAVGSTFGGVDPDFVQLSGVTVNPDGTLTANAPTPAVPTPVSIEASESPDPGDGSNTVSFTATVSAPGVADQTFTGTGVGSVTFSLPMTAGASNTISWSATFDGGAHPCPGPLTPGNLMPSPFTVQG